MKKLTALFLALLMLVSMCACASPASTEDAYQAKVALCLVTPVMMEHGVSSLMTLL